MHDPMNVKFDNSTHHTTMSEKTEKNIRFVYQKKIAVAQWLRCYATNRKVSGSIPAGIIGIFH